MPGCTKSKNGERKGILALDRKSNDGETRKVHCLVNENTDGERREGCKLG